MRIGMSSGGRWWISMGPLGWLLAGWLILPVMAAWYLLAGLRVADRAGSPVDRRTPRKERMTWTSWTPTLPTR